MRLRLSVLAITLSVTAASLSAQQAIKASEPEVSIQRLEVGGQYIYLGSSTCYYAAGCQRPPAVAFGPSLAVNVTRHLAVDSSFSTTVQQQRPPTDFYDGTNAGGRGTALMIGPRLELRRRKYGVFVFGEAGYQSWSEAPGHFVATPVSGGVAVTQTPPARRTFFATGGGIGGEYTPTPRTHLRASVAERVVHYPAVETFVTCSACVPATGTWRESEVFSAGLLMGVGPTLRGSGLLNDYVPPHRFFGRTNVLLIAGATLAGVTDAVVTRHFLFNGLSEGDAIERPFVQNGVGGFVAIGLITETAAIGMMYGLHRMGHHLLERLLPVAVMLGEGKTCYNVVRDTY